MNADSKQPESSKVVLYQTADGKVTVDVLFARESFWLTQKLTGELFQVGVNTVNYHLKEIYEDGELTPEATIRKYRIVQTEGSRQIGRAVDHYNLAAVLAVGYRVKSHRGTQFRIWATQWLREDMTKSSFAGKLSPMVREIPGGLSPTCDVIILAP